MYYFSDEKDSQLVGRKDDERWARSSDTLW